MTPGDALLDELADLTDEVRSLVEALARSGHREVEKGTGDPAWPSAGSAPAPRRGSSHPPGPRPAPLASDEDAEGAWSRFGGTGDPAARLEALRQRVEACTRCPLASTRRHVVFGEGQPGAILAVVGEGPGAEEDATGRPFVGEAGQMLDRMLTRVLEMKREQVYIANVVKCRPPGNRDPTPAELETCRGYLEEQLAIVRPRCLLALGRHASRFLLQSEQGIKTLRGTWGAWHGIPVMPTFHPAYLLRNPADKMLTFQDLKVLKARLAGGR
ncbi:MAG: uracil-DNA glycosylase [Deltaproteobacteria bacterium]|nr:uracil-DNA glycosylase [Deltaproteobacteria bacterium]